MIKKKKLRLAKLFLLGTASFSMVFTGSIMAAPTSHAAEPNAIQSPSSHVQKARKRNPYSEGPYAEGRAKRRYQNSQTNNQVNSVDNAPVPADLSGAMPAQAEPIARPKKKKAGSYEVIPDPCVVSERITVINTPDGPETITEQYPLPKNFKGWKLSSKGGLSYDNPNDNRYWVKVSGVLRVDETSFSGTYRDRRDDFPNSGFIRTVETYVDSGLGENWLSTIGLTYGAGNSNLPSNRNLLRFADIWIGYTGFASNNEVNIGRHSCNWFGLENSSSTAWNPFMERSLSASAFYPKDGIGILTDWWWNHGAVTLMLTQSDHGSRIAGEGGVLLGRQLGHDRLRGLMRATYAPVHDKGNVWHFGVSFVHRRGETSVNGLPFSDDMALSAWPGLRGRRVRQLVDTGPIAASYITMFNVEAAKQWCSLLLEAEYTEAYVHRVALGPLPSLGSLRFNGWTAQARYILTGEHHSYDVRNGAFDSIEINSPYGAYEIAARYDFVNLSDKDVRGGSQHNVTLGFNWFVNSTVRFSVNYIRANIRPAYDERRPRYLDIFGARFQVRWK